jgi:hypothetical protein
MSRLSGVAVEEIAEACEVAKKAGKKWYGPREAAGAGMRSRSKVSGARR